MMQLNVTPDFKKRSLKFKPDFPAAAKLESVELVIPNPDGEIKTAGLSFIIYSARCGGRKLAVCDAFTGTGTITGTLNLCTDRMVDEFYHLPLGTRRSFHAVLWSEADQWMIGAGRIAIANNPGSDSMNPAPLPADRYPTFEEVEEMIRNSGGLDEPVVRRVNGIAPDNAGNVSITIPGDVSELKDKDGLTLTVQQKNTLATLSTTYASKNHTHSEYALKSELPDVSGFITADKLNLYQLKADAFSGKYADLAGKPSAFPPASHTHAVADVNGLADELSRKLTVPAGGNAGQFLMKTVSGCGWSNIDLAAYITITQARNEFAAKDHEHSQYALASSLQNYAAKVHTHVIGDVAGLQDALDGKAAAGHNHDSAYAPKEATAAALNTKLTIPAGGTAGQVIGKTADGYGWITVSGGASSWNDLTGKPSAFPPSAHTHTQADVTGLADIAAKAHIHANKTTLDKFGETNGKPTFDGSEIGSGSGENNVALTEQAQVSGFFNVAGGTPYRITGYGANNRTLTLALPTGETLPAAAAGTVVYLHVSKSDDTSPQAATVESVDAAAGTVVLTAPLTLPTSVTELSADDDPAFLVFPATSWDADESSRTAGDYNLNAGCGATVQGSICVNVAAYAHVVGLGNVNAGESAAVSGVGNVNHGPESDLGGVGNLNTAGRGVFIRGGGNKAASDDVVIFGRGNTVSGMGAVVIGNCNTEISGREAFGFGNRLTLTGKYSHAIGYSLTVAAPDAMLIGCHGALADTPDNEGAFGIAGGEKDAPAIGFLHRVRKSVANPLYAPAKDADQTGVDSDGEKQYIAEPAFSTEYRGHLLAVSETVTLSGAQTVTLDHDRFARWLLAGTGTATLALANWKDGDSGELIVDTTKQTINIPADWVTLGADITKTPGVYVLEIAMVGDTVFYAIKWPNSGGETSTGDKDNTVWYTLATSNVITLDRSNGELQKVTLTQNCTLTAPVLDADHPTLLLQVTSSSAVTVTVGETNIVTDHTGTFQVGWYWDGSATRRYPAVEVA